MLKNDRIRTYSEKQIYPDKYMSHQGVAWCCIPFQYISLILYFLTQIEVPLDGSKWNVHTTP